MAITLDFSGQGPKFTRPEILQHPQIPGPLSGMNPRTIFGRTWWDDTRRAAYRLNNFHCHACGGAPDDDPFKAKLDAHECYEITWKECQATYLETVALCYRCHSFIHAGRFRARVETGDEKARTLIAILKHGMRVLTMAQQFPPLYPFWRTYVIYLEYVERAMPGIAVGRARDLGIVDPFSTIHPPDHKWTLRVYGVTYRRDTHGDIKTEAGDLPPLRGDGQHIRRILG